MHTIAFAIWLIVVGLVLLWAAYWSGRSTGYWAGHNAAKARMQPRIDLRDAARAADGERFATLASQHARQQRRLRGVLGEARRWKAVAVGLGWKRTGATPGCRACGNGCVNCALAGAMRAVAAGLSVPPRRRWTTVADAVATVPAADAPVRPSIVILPPQETAEAAERLAATARRLLADVGDGAARGGS